MTIGLVWAQAANGVIGADGGLPWHLPEDLARFKALTLGATVVMGRATWESLPAPVRPLPGRRNVVLSRRRDWSAPGAEVERDLVTALSAPGDAWVIGGASVYAAALPLADVVVVTELERPFAGDTYAPELGPRWVVTGCDPAEGWATSRSGLRFRVLTYVPQEKVTRGDRATLRADASAPNSSQGVTRAPRRPISPRAPSPPEPPSGRRRGLFTSGLVRRDAARPACLIPARFR